MSYVNLFAATGGSHASTVVEMSGLDTEALYGEQLLANLAQLGESQEELSRQGDTVEALLSAFEANAESKGAANVVFAMVNHLSGGQAEAVTGVSMEDFSMEALDGLKNAASAAYDAVIKMIKDLMRTAKAFMGELFDKFPGLKKDATKLRDKADATEGSIENKKIKIGGAHRILCGGDKKIAGLPASLKTINGLRESSAVDQITDWLKDSRVEEFEGSADELANLQARGIVGDALISKVKIPALTSGQPAALNGRDIKAQKDLPGDKMFAVSYKPADANGNATIAALGVVASIKAGFYDQTEKKLDVKDVETETLEASEVSKICDAVEEICETYAKGRKEIEEGLKQQERIIKVLEKVKGNVDKSDYKDVKPTLNAIKNALSNVSKLATQPASAVSAYAYSVAAASLSYGEKSLAQYKKD